MTEEKVRDRTYNVKRYKTPDDLKDYFLPHEEYVICLNDEKAEYYFNKVRGILKNRAERVAMDCEETK